MVAGSVLTVDGSTLQRNSAVNGAGVLVNNSQASFKGSSVLYLNQVMPRDAPMMPP